MPYHCVDCGKVHTNEDSLLIKEWSDYTARHCCNGYFITQTLGTESYRCPCGEYTTNLIRARTCALSHQHNTSRIKPVTNVCKNCGKEVTPHGSGYIHTNPEDYHICPGGIAQVADPSVETPKLTEPDKPVEIKRGLTDKQKDLIVFLAKLEESCKSIKIDLSDNLDSQAHRSTEHSRIMHDLNKKHKDMEALLKKELQTIEAAEDQLRRSILSDIKIKGLPSAPIKEETKEEEIQEVEQIGRID